MKVFLRALLALVLGVMLLSYGKTAMAKGASGPGRNTVQNALEQCRVFDTEVLNRLDLTAEQKEAVRELTPAEFEQGNSKVREMMGVILERGSADQALIGDAEDDVADRLMEEEENVATLYEILTPEQRQRLETAMSAQQKGNGNSRRPGGGGSGQGGPGQGGPGQGGPGQGRGQGNPLAEKLTQELDLTDNQEEQVIEILEENHGQRQDPMQETQKMRASQRKLFEIAWTEMPNLDLIRQTVDGIAAERVERMADKFETMSQVRAILTNEQQEKLDTLMEDRQGEGLFQAPMPRP